MNAAYFNDVDTEITSLTDRHPLVFDDESLHGNAALLAAAALIVDWRDNEVTARDRQVRDLTLLIQTLQQYRGLVQAGITATWPEYQYETDADRRADEAGRDVRAPLICRCGGGNADPMEVDPAQDTATYRVYRCVSCSHEVVVENQE